MNTITPQNIKKKERGRNKKRLSLSHEIFFLLRPFHKHENKQRKFPLGRIVFAFNKERKLTKVPP